MKLFKKIVSLTLGITLAVSATAFPVYADINNGFTDTEIEESEIKPRIFIDNISVFSDKATAGMTVPISIYLSGASNKYSTTGFHILYDKRLEIARNADNTPNIIGGSATGALEKSITEPKYKSDSMKDVFVSTVGDSDKGLDGQMWTVFFTLPDGMESGDVFNVTIEYKENIPDCESLFTNTENDTTGQLMQAYLFTSGITSGSIKITDPPTTTAPVYTQPSLTTISMTTTTTTKPQEPNVSLFGDADLDGSVNINDTVLVMQSIANPDKYKLSTQGSLNADVVDSGGGITNSDALVIQYIESKKITESQLPITSEELDKMVN